jgi:hypothetical protein
MASSIRPLKVTLARLPVGTGRVDPWLSADVVAEEIVERFATDHFARHTITHEYH